MLLKNNRYLLSLSLVLFFILCTTLTPHFSEANRPIKKKITIMCYMNGDNNLAPEVFHAVDMLETIGSTEEVDILALVDGMPGDNGGYGPSWEKTKLLYITRDQTIGSIQSEVLEELGEKNLGDPHVLENFVKKSMGYSSEKYIFIIFAHGRGIVDTQTLSSVEESGAKSVMLSPDETDQGGMSHQEFKNALENGLSGEKFYLMLFFSCLTNMVEVGYELQDVTQFMIGSEDEIRLVNEPPGTFQIRGIESEKLIAELVANPETPVEELGRTVIDSFIDQYRVSGDLNDKDGNGDGKHRATLSLVDCGEYALLAEKLSKISDYLIPKMTDKSTARSLLSQFHQAQRASQKYPSFLNLEYYDLRNFLENLSHYSESEELKTLCRDTLDFLADELILYERHTSESRSHGVSIFLPSFLLPDNIYRSHRSMYNQSSFSKNTSWNELIEIYRLQMGKYYHDILLDRYERAILHAEIDEVEKLSTKISWVLRKDIQAGEYGTVKRYLRIIAKVKKADIPQYLLLELQDALKRRESLPDGEENLLHAVEVFLEDENEYPGA